MRSEQGRARIAARTKKGERTRSSVLNLQSSFLHADRDVFLSGDYKEVPSSKAKTPHEQESLQRQIAATDRQIDTLVYELYGLTEDEVRIVEGGDK